MSRRRSTKFTIFLMLDNGNSNSLLFQSTHIIERAKRLGNLYASVIEENLNSLPPQELARRILKCEAERKISVLQQCPVESTCEVNDNSPLCVYCDEPESKYCKETGRPHMCVRTQTDNDNAGGDDDDDECTGREDLLPLTHEEECCAVKKIDAANSSSSCTSNHCVELTVDPVVVSSGSSSPPSRSVSQGVTVMQETASLTEMKEEETTREKSADIVEVDLITSP
ncbi:uncharacterized protein TM35_000073580 [Trypanosoma theileri]|uniref:Uncharacterized protein n=1 Tax=Trypanosoma theileri TaxID=67003 RepID=A0A1X0P1W9_9TRYP|nr:uncharacterized protein TM35_000073580 [Trypanosoma theileri]ORC90934.1 hypothetical protein TM35_000073580 [Trypanosoma theileri]